jgi:monofunctional glycosyltransferase
MAAQKTSSKKPPVKSKAKTKKSSSIKKKIFSFLLKIMLWFIGISVFVVILFKFVPVPYTPLMLIRSMERNTKEIESKHDWVPLQDISTHLQKAVIASEDGKFLNHNGFDFKAMQKAFSSNLKGKKLKGGSTISQQTAKNVFLWQGRSYFRKALEAYFTVLIEVIWGKERIMEVYLNSIEMGDGIYGAQAAAKHWFHKSASNLTRYEAAAIAAILPSPRKYKATNSSNYVEQRKTKIVRVMRQIKEIEY